MAFDPVHQAQLYLRRGGMLLRQGGAPTVPEVIREPRTFDETAREQWYEAGAKQIAFLEREIETHTGCSLQGRTALDFGCGWGRLALPLAERCERVYGLDVSPKILQSADSAAKRMNVSNVEWMDAGRLAELSGRYDMVFSSEVFQHIPSREGERIFATLIRGLRPGGVGAIHVPVRPARPVSQLLRRNGRRVGLTRNPWEYTYMLMNSYSLNRLGALMADAGITKWHTNWFTGRMQNVDRSFMAANLIFHKD